MQISNQSIKKQSRNKNENYRPTNIFPNSSKIFEICMNYKLKDYSDKILAKYQRGFRKGFGCLPHDLFITKLHVYGIEKCL